MTAVSWPGPNSASMAAWHRSNDRTGPLHLGSSCGREALDEISSGGVMSLDGLRSGAGIDIWHSVVEVNGAPMRLAETGTGPLVVLLHGFPECWYSWRHQLRALAEAGFHAVAPDLRGYGRSDRPEEVEKYTILHDIGDIVGLVDALGARQAVIAGHDIGAAIAWQAALLRPDRFRGGIAMSPPFRSRGFGDAGPPTTLMPQTENALFYQLFLQDPMVEAGMARDLRLTFRYQLVALSGDAPRSAGTAGLPPGMMPRD